MSVTYDWSPVFQAIQGAAQRYQYNKTLNSMFGPQTPQQPPNASPPAAPAATTGLDPEGNPISSYAPPSLPTAPAAGAPPTQPAPATGQQLIQTGMGGGRMAQLMPLLKMLPPEQGMPLLLQAAMRQNEYDPTPRIGTNPNTGQLDQYVVSKDGSGIRWLGVKPREKMEVSDGQAYNPYEVQPGQQVGAPKPPQKPIINEQSGQISYDNGKTFQPIPNYLERAKAIAAAKESVKPPKAANPNAPITLVHPADQY